MSSSSRPDRGAASAVSRFRRSRSRRTRRSTSGCGTTGLRRGADPGRGIARGGRPGDVRGGRGASRRERRPRARSRESATTSSTPGPGDRCFEWMPAGAASGSDCRKLAGSAESPRCPQSSSSPGAARTGMSHSTSPHHADGPHRHKEAPASIGRRPPSRPRDHRPVPDSQAGPAGDRLLDRPDRREGDPRPGGTAGVARAVSDPLAQRRRLRRPRAAQQIAETFHLHPLAMEDAGPRPPAVEG